MRASARTGVGIRFPLCTCTLKAARRGRRPRRPVSARLLFRSVGADDSVRPVPCHSEPVRALAWESASPCLPLRGRWQRVALTEGAISHGNSSPPVACADSPLPAGTLQRGSAALTGRRTPRAFVPLRSTAGRRPLRAVQRTCPIGRLALRPPFIRRRFRLPCSGAKHPARYAVRPPALS